MGREVPYSYIRGGGKGARTNADSESKDGASRSDVLDEIGLAGADESGGLAVVFVVVG